MKSHQKFTWAFKLLLLMITSSYQSITELYLECEWTIPFICSYNSNTTEFANINALTLKTVNFGDQPSINSVIFKTVDEFKIAFSNVHDVRILNVTERIVYTNNFFLLQHMVNVNISWGRIETLTKMIWVEGNNLNSIDISFNKLSVITDNTFSRCKLLKKLFLNNNHLTLIRDKTFVGISSIEEIYLNSNLIDSIEANAFDIPHLEYLFLQNNRLVKLSNGLFSNAPKYLDLSSNQLKNVEGAFDDAIKLTNLIMNNNSELHKVNLNALSELFNLKEISLNGTGFYFYERLPSQYGTVKRRHSIVKHLNIINNFMAFEKDDISKVLSVLSTVFPFLESLHLNANISDLEFATYFPRMYNSTKIDKLK